MSYAIETKKRRFERILDSLTDSTSSTSARNSLGKRRRLSPSTSTTSLTSHYLPSSRAAFLERLETFRHVTKWHISSTEQVNASVWAKRGWICDDGAGGDSDTVFCGSCKQRLHVDLDARSSSAVAEQPEEGDGQGERRSEEDSLALSREIHEGLVKKYQGLVVEAHGKKCPWRNRGCDGSIQRIEGLLNTDTALNGVRTRYKSLVPSIHQVPALAPLPNVSEAVLEDLHFLRDGAVEEGGGDKEDEELHSPSLDLVRLAICGWQRKTDDVVECRRCFRSLGLWLYRSQPPVMDRLDPIDSHLEYCPWRSAEAQDTETTVYDDESGGRTTHNHAGWELVYQAIVKDSARKQRLRTASTPTSTRAPALTPTPATIPDMTSPSSTRSPTSDALANDQQQEKRRLDLLRRVRELKKPFTIKPLLLGKKRSVVAPP
ncbi:hypothetical protein DV735_g5613, partial [Chaetothyriales sp. CBS 134920]